MTFFFVIIGLFEDKQPSRCRTTASFIVADIQRLTLLCLARAAPEVVSVLVEQLACETI